MPLHSKPVFIERPDLEMYCGAGFIPYYYADELKERNI